MESRPEKSILILLTNSFAAINLIHSGLLKQLADRFEIQLSTNLIDEKEMEHLNAHFEMKIQLAHIQVNSPSWLYRLLRIVQKFAFAQHFNIRTEMIKIGWPVTFSGWLFRRFPVINLFLLKIIRKYLITRSTNLKPTCRSDFAGVISTSPFDFRENQIVNVFRQCGVKSLAIIVSWDNLTSKGVMNADHEVVLVWNQFMVEEFQRFYQIYGFPSKVLATGIPRFDIYSRLESKLAAKHFRERLLLSEDEKIILFTTGATKHFVDQTYVVQDLLDYCQSCEQATLWIKCHPADSVAHYRRFAENKRVKIWCDDSGEKSLSRWLPPINFPDSLAALIHSCNVCVQAASTIRIDAAACNKPVISIYYDYKPGLAYKKSVRRLYDYSHQAPLNALGLDRFVTDKHSLFHALDELLSQPPNQVKYALNIQPFTHFTEPNAVKCSVDHIAEWLGC